MNQAFLSAFSEPTLEYRGKIFWAWNGELEIPELQRQIHIMKEMGFGGFFMHARIGLKTPYLQEKWFQCVAACLEEAKKLGMEAWLYDEDRWPSGAAGGIVTKKAKYRMTYLKLYELQDVGDLRWGKNVIAVFRAEVNGEKIANVRRMLRPSRLENLSRSEKILVFRIEQDRLSNWYNGYTYLDTMNHEAVREFINVTHEEYYHRFNHEFGNTIPGIFTDEPHYGKTFMDSEIPQIPWTRKLPIIFRNKNDYDIIDHLPSIFYDNEDGSDIQVRYHYHDLITSLFVSAYSKQISQWCEKKGIQLTGHLLAEQTLHSQTAVVGSCMRSYEYMQVPGMDLLTEHNREIDTAKQVSSIAHQFGKKWRITELYGGTGWDFPFSGHKAVGDWQLALGINLRCHHLALYTLEGEGKRDYPASIFYQSPWWPYYSKVEDYFGRIHVVMTKGQEVRDLLFIHPVESMWLRCKRNWVRDKFSESEAVAYSNEIAGLRDLLLGQHIDFDYGDEEILSRHARTEIHEGTAYLYVNRARYKAVLVPPLMTIRSTTLTLLQKFKQLGGTVVFLADFPTHIDGSPHNGNECFREFRLQPSSWENELISDLKVLCQRVSITSNDGKEMESILYLLREDEEAYYLFICDTNFTNITNKMINETLLECYCDLDADDICAIDYTTIQNFEYAVLSEIRDPIENFKAYQPKEVNTISGAQFAESIDYREVTIRGFPDCLGHPIELDPETGEIFSAEASNIDQTMEIKTRLKGQMSRTFIIPKKKGSKKYPSRIKPRIMWIQELNNRSWNIELSEQNNLLLDRPCYCIDSGNWSEGEDILKVDRIVRSNLGLPPRGGRMKQPWTQESGENVKRKLRLLLSYSFRVNTRLEDDISLCIEHPQRYRIMLNDINIRSDRDCGWWVDRSLKRIRIHPSNFKFGKNVIVLECEYDGSHPGLESLYLLGDFGVCAKGTEVALIDMAQSLVIGDWTTQGLPFYSGSVTYNTKVLLKEKVGNDQRLKLHVPGFYGTAVRVFVDGICAGIIAWQPNELDITQYVANKESNFSLGIEVLGHRRNSHGPLHHRKKWHYLTSPMTFMSESTLYEPGYQLVPCGLMASPVLIAYI